jgi:hypothetical protein
MDVIVVFGSESLSWSQVVWAAAVVAAMIGSAKSAASLNMNEVLSLVGQVGNLRRIGNPPLKGSCCALRGGLPTRRRLPACTTCHSNSLHAIPIPSQWPYWIAVGGVWQIDTLLYF